MNWLNKIFGTKNNSTQPAKNDDEIKLLLKTEDKQTHKTLDVTQAKTEIQPILFEASINDIYIGLDLEFIDLIYFKDDIEKKALIDKIEQILAKKKITIGQEKVKVIEKLSKLSDKDSFLTRDYLLFQSNTELTLKSGNINEVSQGTNTNLFNGKEKIEEYYTGLSFICDNTTKKIANNYLNFDFELELLKTILKNNELRNFAALNAIFLLGEAYFKARDVEKMNEVFILIKLNKFELSSKLISDYLKNIILFYIEVNEKKQAIELLKGCLVHDPNLTVKQLLKSLEK